MSQLALSPVRLLVCGAGDRGDEGAALIAVATLLPTLESRPRGNLEVRRCGQLAVDDLLAVPYGTAALIIDAASGAEPGTVVLLPLEALADPCAGPVPHSAHALPIDQLVAIAAAMRGRLPEGSFVGIGGRRYGFGQDLSRTVREALPAFRATIQAEIERLELLPVTLVDAAPAGLCPGAMAAACEPAGEPAAASEPVAADDAAEPAETAAEPAYPPIVGRTDPDDGPLAPKPGAVSTAP